MSNENSTTEMISNDQQDDMKGDTAYTFQIRYTDFRYIYYLKMT